MKRYLVLCVSVIRITALSQSDSSHWRLDIALAGGACFTDNTSFSSANGYSKNNLASFSCGMQLLYRVNDLFSAGLGFAYDYRGSNYRRVNDSVISVGINQNGLTGETAPTYFYVQNIIRSLDAPLLLRFEDRKRKISPVLLLGVFPSFTIKHVLRYNRWTGVKEKWIDVDIAETRGNVTAGFMINPGVRIKRFLLDLRFILYNRTDVFSLYNSEKSKAHSVLFGVSYILK